MFQSSLIRSWLPFIAGLILSGVVVHLFWSNNSLEREKKIAEDWAANLQYVNDELISSRNHREEDRAKYLENLQEAEDEINSLERDVTNGRVRLTTKCVPPASPDASGTGEGTSELAPSARQDYFALVRGLEQQYQLLQLCRADLRRRIHGTK